jgi:hypothetical protein
MRTFYPPSVDEAIAVDRSQRQPCTGSGWRSRPLRSLKPEEQADLPRKIEAGEAEMLGSDKVRWFGPCHNLLYTGVIRSGTIEILCHECKTWNRIQA